MHLLFGGGASKHRLPATGSKFETTLDDALEKYGSVLVGHVHMLNLRDVIAKRYANSERMLKKAQKIAVSVIDECLGESDSFFRQGEDAYLFVFPNLDKEAGDLKCSVIAGRIGRQLKAEDPAFAKVKMKTATKVVRPESIGRTKKLPLRPQVAKIESHEDVQRLREEEEKARWATRAVAAMIPQKTSDADGDAKADWYESKARSAQEPSGEIVCLYRPMWHVRNKLLTAYICFPIQRMQGGKVATGMEILVGDAKPAAKAHLDQFVLGRCIATLEPLLAKDQKLLVIAPVHFSTVDRQLYSVPYFGSFAHLSDEAKKLLVLELVGVPEDMPERRISETVAKMRAHARTVLGRVSLDSSNLANWKSVGLHAIGFDLSGDTSPEVLTMKKMEHFVANAAEHGLRTFVLGLSSLSLATGGVAAGFDYIEGEVVHSPVVTPESVLPFESEDLYARLLARTS